MVFTVRCDVVSRSFIIVSGNEGKARIAYRGDRPIKGHGACSGVGVQGLRRCKQMQGSAVVSWAHVG